MLFIYIPLLRRRSGGTLSLALTQIHGELPEVCPVWLSFQSLCVHTERPYLTKKVVRWDNSSSPDPNTQRTKYYMREESWNGPNHGLTKVVVQQDHFFNVLFNLIMTTLGKGGAANQPPYRSSRISNRLFRHQPLLQAHPLLQ